MFQCACLRVPALSVDPESRRLLHVAGGTSKVEIESSQELLRRLESDKSTEFEGTVTLVHSQRVHTTQYLVSWKGYNLSEAIWEP